MAKTTTPAKPADGADQAAADAAAAAAQAEAAALAEAEAKTKAEADAAAAAAGPQLVHMTRDANAYPAPHTAEVHPAEVGNYAAGGWLVATD